MVSSRRGRSPHGRSIPLRHGTRGKCTTAPVIGSVCDVVTLKSVRLSSPVARVPVDVTVPATVAARMGAPSVAAVQELLAQHEASPPSFTVHLYPEHWTLNHGSKFLYNNQVAVRPLLPACGPFV